MEIETKVISTEIIKPSSPTPKHMQKCQLSFLDQVSALILAPIIYFYPSNPKIPSSQKKDHLKKSLSETLSRFYPLAGRLVDNLHIDCNDGGVPFNEAVANCDLSHVITNPDLNKIMKSLLYKLDGSEYFFLAVQVTHFRCGGLAVGILLSHKIADAFSIVMFGNSWSAVARDRGHGGIPFPKFDGAAYFPPGNIPSIDVTAEDIVSKTFTFSAAKIALLQNRYSAGGLRPGRVETVAAYISTRLVSAHDMLADPTKTYILNHPANLRNRMNLPMPKYHFGNIAWIATATPTAGDGGIEVVQKLREAKNAIFVPQLKDLSKMVMAVDSKRSEAVSFTISSMCGFPLYEADFGWGEPVWVVIPGMPVHNLVFMMDTKTGGGIEAVVNLRKQDMDKFDVDIGVPSLLNSNL